MDPFLFLSAGIGVALGVAAGFAISNSRTRRAGADADSLLEKSRREAEVEKKAILADARDEAHRIREEAKTEERERRAKVEEREERLLKREERVEEKNSQILSEQDELEKKERELGEKKKELSSAVSEEKEKLAKIAKLSEEEAREQLLSRVEEETRGALVERVHRVEEEEKERQEKRAQELVADAIQRYAAEVTAETTTTLVELPNDDVKGRIIGREGRNIAAFEAATGVDVIVDDTPNVIIISGFDLVRRYIARVALQQLIKDGRIQPAKIEAAVKKAEENVNKLIKEFGEKAAAEVGVIGLPPEIVKLIGRLRFRTSFGQNALRHSIETAFIAGAMAAEIGVDEQLAKKAGLLHDIGKAVGHEIEGSHVAIGRDIAKKFGMPEPIVHAIEAHHGDVPFKTVEAMLVQAADAISSSRPGARRESIENYVKRLKDIETAALSFEGVKKAFAIQAGHEVRVLVNPQEIDDLKLAKLSIEIAREIEKTVDYPGEIKVNVIRETREASFAR